MDSLLAAAARLLASGDPLGALKRIALRDDAPALALRGIAMAQLGDYEKARELLRRAARLFGTRERLAQARCRVAEAEVALAARDLSQPAHTLEADAMVLEAYGDRANAFHARLVAARRHLLVGEIDQAGQALTDATTASTPVPPALAARFELTDAELALRQIRVTDATAALDRAQKAAQAARIAALSAEIERVRQALAAPAARSIRGGTCESLRLDQVETLFASPELIVDGCRRAVRNQRHLIELAGRPVLFALVRTLAAAWPADVPRDQLIAQAFATRVANESHRARLRVELGRLRELLRPMARIEATMRGFGLVPRRAGTSVVVLAPPLDGPAGSILALLEDGESWSTSALAHALGSSQRTVQRALRQLSETAAVRSVGQGRTQRWLAPALSGFATTLLLPGALSLG